ncbi:hypothetical protein HDU83_009755, partial [Entophlyctis luteolus]
LAGIPVIAIMGSHLVEYLKEEDHITSLTAVLKQASTRLIFLNLIDLGLICVYLLPGTIGIPYVRLIFDNLDNARIAFYAVDALMSKVLNGAQNSGVQSIGQVPSFQGAEPKLPVFDSGIQSSTQNGDPRILSAIRVRSTTEG